MSGRGKNIKPLSSNASKTDGRPRGPWSLAARALLGSHSGEHLGSWGLKVWPESGWEATSPSRWIWIQRDVRWQSQVVEGPTAENWNVVSGDRSRTLEQDMQGLQTG